MNLKYMAVGASALALIATGCSKTPAPSAQTTTQTSTATTAPAAMTTTPATTTPATTPMTQNGVEVGGAMMVPNLNIVQNAMNASNVTTLVAAVNAAGLSATLSGAGPFTVFAPDNNAFAKLPSGTVSNLLLPANKAALAKILEYHVVAGRYQAKDLTNGMKLKTVEGDTITIGKSASGQISVNGSAMVEIPDIISSNGVTFLIDSVLMPPTTASMSSTTSATTTTK
jgi:uncharacterized surface protein with fasciclin (FAS1) repeats